MGRLQKTGISQKTCQRNLIFKAFGKKSVGSFFDSSLKFPCQHKMLDHLKLSWNYIFEKCGKEKKVILFIV